jgi:PAS domain S-box-containing protein
MSADHSASSEHLRRHEGGDLLTVADAIPIDITVLAADGTVLYVNQFALKRLGLNAQEVKDGYLKRTCHPDDLSQVLDERRANLLKGVPFKLEVRLSSKSDEFRWHLAQYNPLIDESGNIIRWYVTAIDIDDRKRAEQKLRQSEEELRTITDAIRQVIVVLTRDGKTLYANQVACEETGLSLNAIMKEGFAPQAYHPDDGDRLQAREEGLQRGVVEQDFDHDPFVVKFAIARQVNCADAALTDRAFDHVSLIDRLSDQSRLFRQSCFVERAG